MKHIIIVSICFLFLSCNKKVTKDNETKTSLITGVVAKDSLSESISLTLFELVSDEFSTTSFVQLDSNKSFRIPLSINIAQPFSLKTSSNNCNLLIFPGDTININFSDSAQITCKNEAHNAFIQNSQKLSKILQAAILKFPFYESVQDNSPDEFKKKEYAFKNQLIKSVELFIESNNIHSIEFRNNAFLDVNFIIASALIDYKYLNVIKYKKEVVLPKDYFSLVDSLVNLQHDNLITINYINFLNRLDMLYQIDKIDTLLKHLNHEPFTLTQDILIARGLSYVLQRDSMKIATNYIADYQGKINNPVIKKMLLEMYNKKLSMLNDPNISNASLIDLSKITEKNSVIKEIIKDHKNKVIYIKFWAPWCGPCMEEIPYDKQLIKKFNQSDFAFINLCIKTTKENWIYTIKDKNMTGYHYLLSNDQYNELAALFNISGVPHHVLIDRRGKIIYKNAPSPNSNDQISINQEFVNEIKKLTKY